MTPELYKESLRDGRTLYFNGEQVDDITAHPAFRVPVAWGAQDYAICGDSALGTVTNEDGSTEPRLFQIPTTEDDLQKRFQLIRQLSPVSEAVGALFALMNSRELLSEANPEYALRIESLMNRCRENDLRVAQVVTDPKGDRSKVPKDQDDPDLYLHIVERRDDGIVVRGAKLHITAAALVHEFIVLPTRRMGPGEEDYAVGFSVPVNTPGISIINKMIQPPTESTFDYPASNQHRMPEGFVVFDDVFIPWDRVFLCGETQLAGKMARNLGLWERITGLASMVDRAQTLVGVAQLLAHYNGIATASHVIDKVTELIFSNVSSVSA